MLSLLTQTLLAPASHAETLTIEGRAGAGEWQRGPVVVLAGEAVSVRLPQQAEHSVRWYQIFPELDTGYQNANRGWEPNPYQWTGFDTIAYQRVELVGWRDAWEVAVVAAGGSPLLVGDPGRSRAHHTDMGSFWLEAEVLDASGAVVARTVGLSDNDEQGIQPSVFRLTVRKDDTFLGVLSGFLNVPGVFGSVTRQSREYIGVDCADVMVSAWRELNGRTIARNVNVAHLVDELPLILRTTVSDGVPGSPLRWGEDIHPGDLIAVKYAGSRQYGHVGAVYSDSDGDGLLSPADLVLHAGPQPLHLSRMSDGGFDGEVVLLRPGLI